MYTHAQLCQGWTGDEAFVWATFTCMGLWVVDSVTWIAVMHVLPLCAESQPLKLQVLSRVVNYCMQILFINKNVCKHVLLKAKFASFDEPWFSQAVTAKSVYSAGSHRKWLTAMSTNTIASSSVHCFGHVPGQAAACSALRFRFMVQGRALPMISFNKVEKDIEAKSHIRKGAESLPPDPAVAICCIAAM